MATRPGTTIVINRTAEVVQAIKRMAGARVLIGIPEAKDPRKDGGGIGNAALGYIHEFGAPEANIPARPFLIPGVENGSAPAMAYLQRGMEKTLDGDAHAIDQALEAAGMTAASAVKNKITSGPFEPLAPATIRARRRRSKGSKYRRKATTAADVKPLIDTGALRQSITYVVDK